MTFDNQLSILILGGVAVLLSANITLVKGIFSVIHKNFDSVRDTQPHLAKIRDLWDSDGFLELLALARLSYDLLAGICLFVLLSTRCLSDFPVSVAMGINFAIICMLLFLLTIFLPNIFSRMRPYRLARSSLTLFIFSRLIFTSPSRWIHSTFELVEKHLGYDERLNFLTDSEKEQLHSEYPEEDEDALEEDEKKMIRNIMDLGETTVKEIMTPRIDMVALEAGSSLQKVVHLLNTERHSRVPVYGESQDNILGILHSRDFLQWYSENGKSESFEVLGLVRPAYFVTRKKMVDDLMREFRRTRSQIAIVVDEYGGTSGLVTLEDVLEEIVGDIRDEDDKEEARVLRIQKNRYLINPVISLADLSDELGFPVEPADKDIKVDTLGGLLQACHESIPAKDEVVKVGTLEFRILKVEGQRLEKVLLTFDRQPASSSNREVPSP